MDHGFDLVMRLSLRQREVAAECADLLLRVMTGQLTAIHRLHVICTGQHVISFDALKRFERIATVVSPLLMGEAYRIYSPEIDDRARIAYDILRSIKSQESGDPYYTDWLGMFGINPDQASTTEHAVPVLEQEDGYRLHLSLTQAAVLAVALDFRTRVAQGLFDSVLLYFNHTERFQPNERAGRYEIAKDLLEQSAQEMLGIGFNRPLPIISPLVPEHARIAHDLARVLRYRLKLHAGVKGFDLWIDKNPIAAEPLALVSDGNLLLEPALTGA